MNPPRANWLGDSQLWLESFATINVVFLALDIYLAHSVNQFSHVAEYIPLYYSLAAPLVMLLAIVLRWRWGWIAPWRDLGYLVAWLAIAIGLAGTLLHLDSRFFYERTLKSLVYAAPFAAPLAYTGVGLLLLMNRLVDPRTREWAQWVVLLALGGFVGNFIFSLTDHAQNGFYRWSEWIPVATSAVAIGCLLSLFLTPATRPFLWVCVAVLGIQALTGVLGFALHTVANLEKPGTIYDNFIHGAPALAPLLFPNLALLCLIGLWELRGHVATTDVAPLSAPARDG
jgi:hypothetical protein